MIRRRALFQNPYITLLGLASQTIRLTPEAIQVSAQTQRSDFLLYERVGRHAALQNP